MFSTVIRVFVEFIYLIPVSPLFDLAISIITPSPFPNVRSGGTDL